MKIIPIIFLILSIFQFTLAGDESCSHPETNATNALRLAHTVCPGIYTTNTGIKESARVYYYNNSIYNGTGQPISITLDGKKITQEWKGALATTLYNLRNRINVEGSFNAVSSSIYITVTAKEHGYKIDTNGTGASTTEANNTIIRSGNTSTKGIVKLTYYGNAGNYSIVSGGIIIAETPYLDSPSSNSLYQTLKYLKDRIDANQSYSATQGSHYLQITDNTARVMPTITGKSGNGNAATVTLTQGQANLKDANMTNIAYDDGYLYTTFNASYDSIEPDAKQDILEIFKVDHRDTSSVSNTIDFTSVIKRRHKANFKIDSISSVNDILFIGDKDSSYYKFNRHSKSLGSANKVIEPNDMNVTASHSEYYKHSDGHGYIFLADGSKLRIYRIERNGFSITHYKTEHTLGGEISDIYRDNKSVYVQSEEGGKLTQFAIVDENSKFSIERIRTMALSAKSVYVDKTSIYYTRENKGYQAKIKYSKDASNNDTSSIIDENEVDGSKISFIVGDQFYSATIGEKGLRIFDHNRNLVAQDNAYKGSQLLTIGESIITNDLNSSQIRIYKFGEVGISPTDGTASVENPLYLRMWANKMNLESVKWTLTRSNGAPINFVEKDPSYSFTESGMWYAEATIKYKKKYPLNSVYKFQIDIQDDDTPIVNISSSVRGGVAGTTINFTSTITRHSAVDYIKWDFDDGGGTSFVRNPSWKFKTNGDYNVSFVVFYDRDKNITKSIPIKISSPIEINASNADRNDSSTFVVNEDINFSAKLFNIISDSDVESYSWKFGDTLNTTSTFSKPIFAYLSAGDKTVSLEIVKRSDKSVLKTTKLLTIIDEGKAGITTDVSKGESNLKVQFGLLLTKYTVKNIYPASVVWNFGDSTATKGSVSPVHTYTSAGTGSYTVAAVIALSDGSTDTLTKNIYVDNTVKLDFNASLVTGNVSNPTKLEGYAPMKIILNATGSAYSGINRIEWDMSNKDDNLSGKNIEYTFDTNGTYTIKVAAISNKGNRIVKNIEVNVSKSYPIVISAVVNPNNELDYNFSVSGVKSSDGQPLLKSYKWMINDEEIDNDDKDILDYTFLESKDHHVGVKVTLNDGTIVKHYYNNKELLNPFIHTVSVHSGWNLVSSPIALDLNTTGADDLPSHDILSIAPIKALGSPIWIYSGGTWKQNPDHIPKGAGMWIKATGDKIAKFNRPNLLYEPKNGDVETGWNLMGTGKELKNFHNLSDVNLTWVYTNTWIKNPPIIKKSQGFWAKHN